MLTSFTFCFAQESSFILIKHNDGTETKPCEYYVNNPCFYNTDTKTLYYNVNTQTKPKVDSTKVYYHKYLVENKRGVKDSSNKYYWILKRLKK